jgi:phage shock protein A
MTQNEMNSLIKQINSAFEEHFHKLETLEAKVADLEAQMSALHQKESSNAKGSTTGKGRSKRIQQAEEDS